MDEAGQEPCDACDGNHITAGQEARAANPPALRQAGSQMRTVVPSPGRLSRAIRPPWASTIRFESASPSPAPPVSRARLRSPRKKGVKTCSRSWEANPDAAVAHADRDTGHGFGQRHVDGGGRVRVLGGTVEEVVQHAASSPASASNRRPAAAVSTEPPCSAAPKRFIERERAGSAAHLRRTGPPPVYGKRRGPHQRAGRAKLSVEPRGAVMRSSSDR